MLLTEEKSLPLSAPLRPSEIIIPPNPAQSTASMPEAPPEAGRKTQTFASPWDKGLRGENGFINSDL